MEKQRRIKSKTNHFEAAELYRTTEQEYLASIHNMIYHHELDEEEISHIEVYHPHQLASDFWVEGVRASMKSIKMQNLEEKYGLIVGGATREHLVGEKVVFDPAKHIPLEDPYDPPFKKGDSVVVEMSQISTLKEGEEDVILPPVVTHHKSDVSSLIQEEEKVPTTQPSNELRR